MSEEPTDRELIETAYQAVLSVLDPLFKGDGETRLRLGSDPEIMAARYAYVALQLLRQYAIHGSPTAAILAGAQQPKPRQPKARSRG